MVWEHLISFYLIFAETVIKNQGFLFHGINIFNLFNRPESPPGPPGASLRHCEQPQLAPQAVLAPSSRQLIPLNKLNP